MLLMGSREAEINIELGTAILDVSVNPNTWDESMTLTRDVDYGCNKSESSTKCMTLTA
jgi:hypothetical protein